MEKYSKFCHMAGFYYKKRNNEVKIKYWKKKQAETAILRLHSSDFYQSAKFLSPMYLWNKLIYFCCKWKT